MGRSRVWRSLIVLTLGMGSASTLAQSGGAAGTLLDVFLRPIPSPPPVASVARPIDLPLAPGELLKPFVNGCAVVVLGRDASPNIATTNTNWYGNCRFGLAHGDGIEEVVANKLRVRRRYQYGVVVGTIDPKSSFPYLRSIKDGVYLTQNFEDGRREAVGIRSPDLNARDLKAAYPVWLTIEEPGLLVFDHFEPIGLECSADGKVYWRGVTISDADHRAADVDCERYQASLGPRRMPRNSALADIGNVVSIQQTHQTRPTGGVDSPKEITARFCAGGAKSADCDRVLQEMLQPYAPRIQAIIDGQRRQYAEGLPWLTAHYAPLEAALDQKMRAMAARYASQSPRPAAPSGVRP